MTMALIFFLDLNECKAYLCGNGIDPFSDFSECKAYECDNGMILFQI